MNPKNLLGFVLIPLAYLALLTFVVDEGVVSALLAPSDAAGGLRLFAALATVLLRLVCVFVLPAWAAGLAASALYRRCFSAA